MPPIHVKYPRRTVSAPFFASGKANTDVFAVTGVLRNRNTAPIPGATLALLEPGHGHNYKRWMILFLGDVPDGDYDLVVTGFVDGREPYTDDRTVVRVRVLNGDILDITSHNDNDNITDEVGDFMAEGTYTRPAAEVKLTPSSGQSLCSYYISNQSGVWAAFFDPIPRPTTTNEYYTLTAMDLDYNQAEPVEGLQVDHLFSS